MRLYHGGVLRRCSCVLFTQSVVLSFCLAKYTYRFYLQAYGEKDARHLSFSASITFQTTSHGHRTLCGLQSQLLGAGGVLGRLRKQLQKPLLPSVFLSIVRSLANQLDHQGLLHSADHEDVVESTHTENLELEGFTVHRQIRSSNKKRGGGLCMYVREQSCSKVANIVRAHTFFTLMCTDAPYI